MRLHIYYTPTTKQSAPDNADRTNTHHETGSAAYDMLAVCAQTTCPVLELDLSNNSIHHLADFVELTGVVCRLTHLNLTHNALGEFDDDADGEVSVGTDETCGALGALLTQYTSLTSLDLSSNAFHNAEVASPLELACSYTAR